MKAAERVARTRAFLQSEGLDAIIVRSCTDLMWLTGFERVFDTERAHTAVLSADAAVLHTDSRYVTAMRAAGGEEGLWEIDDSPKQGMAFAADALAALGLSRARVCIDASMPLCEYRALARALPEAHLVEREGDIVKLRAVKDAAEVALLQRAQDIASEAFLATLRDLRPGVAERDVALSLEMAMRERCADELAFGSIVASGPNSANPHAVPGERVLQRGDLVVFDFGARVNGYCSDTTRTVSVGTPTARQQRLYTAVREANEEVERAIRPGVTGRQMHELALSVLAEHGFAGKMGHSLGHGVGLDIHELPLASPRNDEPFAVGNVVTVEPGVYLAGEHGARLEDCVVITEGGHANFCGLSHELAVVE